MRNWNSARRFLLETAFRIASLPMRNWNGTILGRPVIECPIASLPMRNWNISISLYWFCSVFHCQPTYEELKLCPACNRYDRVSHCQPTYEELKLFVDSNEVKQIFNCQPTYEELKRSVSLPVFLFQWCIASLPMRNWNSFNSLQNLLTEQIASLPMRNWNL